jgi:hypothetical protein
MVSSRSLWEGCSIVRFFSKHLLWRATLLSPTITSMTEGEATRVEAMVLTDEGTE